MRRNHTSVSMWLGAPQDWVATAGEERPLRFAVFSWKYHCLHQTRHLISAFCKKPGVFVVKRGPFKLVKSVLFWDRTSACLKISSVFAVHLLSAFGHHPLSLCWPQEVKGSVYSVIIRKHSLDVLWGVVQLVAPGFPSDSDSGGLGNVRTAPKCSHLRPHSRATPILGVQQGVGGGAEVSKWACSIVSLALSLRCFDILYQEQTNPPKMGLPHTISLCDLLHNQRQTSCSLFFFFFDYFSSTPTKLYWDLWGLSFSYQNKPNVLGANCTQYAVYVT